MAVLIARHPDPGECGEAFCQRLSATVEFPGQWRTDTGIAGHLVDHTFCIAPNLHGLIPDPQIDQSFETVDKSQILRDIRTGLALAKKETEASSDFQPGSFEDPSVAEQAERRQFAVGGL